MKLGMDFLYDVTEEDFEILAEIIRNQGGVNCSLKTRNKYGNKHKYVDAVIDELLKYGSYTFWFKKPYVAVLTDVCENLDVKYDNNDEMGIALLGKVFGRIYDDLSHEKKNEIINAIFSDDNERRKYYGDGSSFSFENVFKMGDNKILYILTMIMVNGIAKAILGRGLSLASGMIFTRALSLFSGPLAAIIGAWTIKELTGPAYRVTIPAVVYIESMRIIKDVREMGINPSMEKPNDNEKNDGVIYL